MPGPEEGFALTVAEGDQGWSEDSRPEDGEQVGILLFADLRCRQCHLHPRTPLQQETHQTSSTGVSKLGMSKAHPASAAGDLSLVSDFYPDRLMDEGQDSRI